MSPSPIPCKVVVLEEGAAKALIEAESEAKDKPQYARAPQAPGYTSAASVRPAATQRTVR